MVNVSALILAGAKRSLASRLATAARAGDESAITEMGGELFAHHRTEARRRGRILSANARAHGMPVRTCPECGDVPAPAPELVAPGGIPSCPLCGLPTTEASE